MDKLRFEDCLNDGVDQKYAHEVFGITKERALELRDQFSKLLYDLFMDAFENGGVRIDVQALKAMFASNDGLTIGEYSWLIMNLQISTASIRSKAEADYDIKQREALKSEPPAPIKKAVESDGKLMSFKHRSDGEQ